jgi:hypothetical protein
MVTWCQSVIDCIKLKVQINSTFDRQFIIENCLQQISAEVSSDGSTPDQTLSRVLQELRNSGCIEFVDNNGTYRLIKTTGCC